MMKSIVLLALLGLVFAFECPTTCNAPADCRNPCVALECEAYTLGKVECCPNMCEFAADNTGYCSYKLYSHETGAETTCEDATPSTPEPFVSKPVECEKSLCGAPPAVDACPDGTTPAQICMGWSVENPDMPPKECTWKTKRCAEQPCPAIKCETYCMFGTKRDANGCPTCQCNDSPCFPNTADMSPAAAAEQIENYVRENCEPFDCADGVVRFDQEKCCPYCDDDVCDPAACPDATANTNCVWKHLEGECCPKCVEIDCTLISCPEFTEACPPNFQLKVGDCGCKYCKPVVTCDLVLCAETPKCENGKLIQDGCCPVCVERPTCDNVECPAIAECPAGQELVRVDGSCCATCLPKDRCLYTDCAKPNCPEEAWIKREGECCPQCPINCVDSDTERCDDNDEPVCTPGYYRKDANGECTPVDPNDRIEKELGPFCLTSTSEFEDKSETLLKFILANGAQSGEFSANIRVTFVPSDDGSVCFKVFISAERTDTSVDVDSLEQAIQRSIESDPANFSSPSNQPDTKSSASVLAAGALVAIAALI